jgi:UDP-N-acetylmuramoyl-tripeptide--D-alanyl-D-alanine ligase
VTQYFFGTDDGCAVRLLDMKTTVAGVVFTASLFGRKLKALLPLPAPRLVMNALAAAGVACQLGLSPDDIRQALASFQPGRNRLEIRLLAAGGIVINDVYNANPLSMQNALEVLAALSSGKKSAAVLGDMYELGAYATTGHQLVGKKAAALRIDTLVTVGELAAIIGQSARRAGMPANQVHSFIQPSDCLAWLREQVTPDQVVLFKASRGVKLETILAGWLDGGTD